MTGARPEKNRIRSGLVLPMAKRGAPARKGTEEQDAARAVREHLQGVADVLATHPRRIGLTLEFFGKILQLIGDDGVAVPFEERKVLLRSALITAVFRDDQALFLLKQWIAPTQKPDRLEDWVFISSVWRKVRECKRLGRPMTWVAWLKDRPEGSTLYSEKYLPAKLKLEVQRFSKFRQTLLSDLIGWGKSSEEAESRLLEYLDARWDEFADGALSPTEMHLVASSIGSNFSPCKHATLTDRR